MTRFSVFSVLLASFAASACTDSGTKPAQTPGGEDVGQTTEALSAYLSSDGSTPIRIDQLAIHATEETRAELARLGCGSVVSTGEGGVRFRGRASYPTTFVEWASAELVRRPAATAPHLRIAIANENNEVKCRVDVTPASLETLTMNGGQIDDVKLAWEMKGGVNVAVGDVNGDGVGGDTSGQTPGDIAAPPDEPVAIGLLLPAVQKVREAAVPQSDYPLFEKGGVLPPPFELQVDEETYGELFDGAIGDELEIGVLAPRPTANGTHTGGGGAGKVSMQDISFMVELKKEAIAGPRTKLKAVPSSGFGIAPPITDTRLAAAKAKADILIESLSATLNLDEVSRLLAALEAQPSGAGVPPSAYRDELLKYWRGNPTDGTPGAETAFDNGMGSFLKKASDVEGAWAYKRVPIAARILSRLDSTHGRALCGAAMLAAADAAFPLLPGRLRASGDLAGHDYRVARAAVAEMASMTDIIAGGGEPLAGIEPDEIDVALESKDEVLPAVSSVDAAARSFLLARDALLDAPTVDGSAPADLTARSDALAQALDALLVITKARFASTK